jgi:hypothetical protein
VEDVVPGLLAVVIGLVLTFFGYVALRAVISVWGAFVGFVLGAALAAQFTADGFLGSVVGWVVALIGAVAFGAIAYLYYAVSVVIAMGAIGFVLGTTVITALGVTWSWVVVVVGVLAGVALAMVAIVGDLPMLILTVLSALAGASITVTGVLLLSGELGTDDLATDTTGTLDLGGLWLVLYALLVVAGLVVQLRRSGNRAGTLRGTWDGRGAARASR